MHRRQNAKNKANISMRADPNIDRRCGIYRVCDICECLSGDRAISCKHSTHCRRLLFRRQKYSEQQFDWSWIFCSQGDNHGRVSPYEVGAAGTDYRCYIPLRLGENVGQRITYEGDDAGRVLRFWTTLKSKNSDLHCSTGSETRKNGFLVRWTPVTR